MWWFPPVTPVLQHQRHEGPGITSSPSSGNRIGIITELLSQKNKKEKRRGRHPRVSYFLPFPSSFLFSLFSSYVVSSAFSFFSFSLHLYSILKVSQFHCFVGGYSVFPILFIEKIILSTWSFLISLFLNKLGI